MRFALDMKERLGVENVCEYLSGTIYPDSRHFTGIDRVLTHPKPLLERAPHSLTDFEKGWFAHMLCDRMQYFLTMDRFPEVAAMEEGEGNARWIKHTALKLLQDIDDVQRFDIKSYLHCLEYALNPNGEDIQAIREYNVMFNELYADPSHMTPTTYTVMWEKSKVSREISEGVTSAAQDYVQDEVVMTKLSTLYLDTLKRAEESLSSK